ncbi:beta-lactamase family protein [SAR202 cluster bacterium AC-647-P02_OGT_505m]|nr:beta-lactamase family protein [SAR202 cluster bacterium AC-647-P02_OGT_505m]
MKSGMSSRRLGLIDDHIERNYIDTGKFTGSLVGIYRKGRLVHDSTMGLMDRERKKPVEWDTVFRIFSMTKPVTSVALMMLFEKGLIQLDDPVYRYIPSFRKLEVYVSGVDGSFETRAPDRSLTIKDLLSHQSGFTYDFLKENEIDAAYSSRGIGSATQKDLASLIDSLSDLPLLFSPGDRWNYSVSTDVCGHLVELISGQSLDTFFYENIFEPLGMSDTGFYVPAVDIPRFSANYLYNLNGLPKLLDDPLKSRFIKRPSFLSGGGGLVSTAEDYLSFCRMILGGGQLNGNRILSRKTIDLMSANHLTGGVDLAEVASGRWSETSYQGMGFGLGFSVVKDPSMTLVPGSVGELAWGGMANTAFWIDPLEDMAVVFMTQLVPSGIYNIRRELRTLVYSAIED